MKPEDVAKLSEALKDNPVVSAQLLKQIKEAIPNAYSPNRAYYAKHFAMQMKPLVDKMLEDKQPYKLLYADYPQWSYHTLRIRIFDSLKYLADFDETPEGKCREWYANVTKSIIKTDTGKHIGILFSSPVGGIFKPQIHKVSEEEMAEMTKDGNLDAKVLEPKRTWQEVLTDFLESDTRNIKIDGLSLTDDEVELAKTMIADHENMTNFINKKMIVLYRGTINTDEA